MKGQDDPCFCWREEIYSAAASEDNSRVVGGAKAIESLSDQYKDRKRHKLFWWFVFRVEEKQL